MVSPSGVPEKEALTIGGGRYDKNFKGAIDDLRIYKPHPSVYQLAVDRLELGAREISFQSSNAWDAVGAAAFGFRVAWVNRFDQARERLPAQPDAELLTLAELPSLVIQ